MMLTRAQFLRVSAAAIAGGTPVATAFTEARSTMLTRPIPSSGIPLPVVGVGTWRGFDVGADAAARAQRADVLRALFDAGGRVIDSSPMYGSSEDVAGALLTQLQAHDRAFVATKVWTEGREAGIEQMDASMRKLQHPRIELMQIHNLVDWRTHLVTLREWKRDGRVGHIGITHYRDDAHAALEAVIRAEALDSVQLNYSIDNRAAEERLLPLAADRGVAVLVNLPFGGGGLLKRVQGRTLPCLGPGARVPDLGADPPQVRHRTPVGHLRDPRHQPRRAYARERRGRVRQPPRRGSAAAHDRGHRVSGAPHVMPPAPSPGHGLPSPDGLDRVALHRATAWVVLTVSLLTCLLGWYHGDRTMRRRAEDRFVHQAEDATARLQEQLARYEDVLRSAAAFARSTPAIDRSLWHAYVNGLALREAVPGMVGIGFTPRVRHEDLAAHVERLRAQGFPAYDVWPAGQRADHYPVAYFEPESENLRQALGFDLGSDATRLSGIEQARDSGRVVLVGGVRLRRDPRAPHAPAFALLMPVYGASLPPGGLERQRSALLGFVYAPFRLPDAVAAVTQRQPAPRFSLREGGQDGPVLHLDEGSARIEGVPLFTVVREVLAGGQRWSLVFEAGPSSLASTERLMSAVAALAALALNGVLAMLLFAQRRVRSRAEALAEERAVALQRSEGAFLAVAESARVAIVTTDAQGRLTYANAAAEQMLGAAREQLRGVSSMHYIAEADRERFADGLRKFLSGKGRVAAGAAIQITGRRHSGELFPFEISLSWYDAPEGRYITGVLVDLTERLRTEAVVRDAEERWKVALESTDDGVWDWDVATGTLYGSRRLFELVGHDAPTGAIHIDRWHALVHPDDLPGVLRDLDAHLAGGRDRYVSEHRIQTRDGEWRWLLARGRIITSDAHGRPARVVGTCTDITERRQTEETLRFAREQAEEAARSRSDFLAIMSHELRTPMNGVLGMTNLLSSTRLTDEQREYLEIIGRSGNALLRLIDDILDFSKIEAGRVVLEQMACDVGAIAREVVTLLSVQAGTKRLHVDAHVVAGTPATVITDPGRVRQVLFNLVGNAIKFTHAGAVHVTVGADAADGGRITLRVTVTDTGIGIAEDKQRLLFEKFTQADASTTRRFGGTGLGLAISKGLVESLGGTIGVTSTVGVGSQFWFTLVAPAATEIEAYLPPFAADAPALDAALPGRRILVAEDNPVNQRVAVRMLEKLGYVADVAVDGREAVRMAQDTRYAAILMDCHMPDVDGYEATRRIKEALSADRCPPILAMTAAGADGDRERCLRAGMSDYLSKPVQMPVLREMLERWTRTPGSPEPAPTAAEP